MLLIQSLNISECLKETSRAIYNISNAVYSVDKYKEDDNVITLTDDSYNNAVTIDNAAVVMDNNKHPH